MPVVLVVRVADDQGATPEVLLRNAQPLVVAVRVGVYGDVAVSVERVDVLLQVVREGDLVPHVL